MMVSVHLHDFAKTINVVRTNKNGKEIRPCTLLAYALLYIYTRKKDLLNPGTYAELSNITKDKYTRY